MNFEHNILAKVFVLGSSTEKNPCGVLLLELWEVVSSY